MVGRRRDQPYPGSRVAYLGNELIDLVSGQLAALARLGPLGDFDLQLVSVDQIV